jgi:glycine hydroxymethyltransferase
MQGGPLMHVIAAKAVAFGEALRPDFKTYAHAGRRQRQGAGRDAAGGGFDLVTGGTDNHLMLVDLRPKGLTGKAAEAALGRAHITCNKNGVPFDPEKPFDHLRHPPRHAGGDLARLRHRRVRNAQVEAAVREKVKDLTTRFPIYS